MPIVSFNPVLQGNTTTAQFTLGGIYEFFGDGTSTPIGLYLYVRNANGASDNAIADGDLCYRASATAETVCNALNGTGSALAGNQPLGVGVGAIAKNKYGFILKEGRHTNVRSTSTTAGVKQKASATAATVTDQTAATIPDVGTAVTATSGGRCTMDVRC